MDTSADKQENNPNFCNHLMASDGPSRYLPLFEAGFWPGPTTLSPFLMGSMGRDIPPFWPVPWLPQLWPSATQNVKQDSIKPMVPSTPVASPSVENSPQASNESTERIEQLGTAFRSPSLSVSPTLNCTTNINGHRPRTGAFVDPLLALTSMDASPAISRALASSLPRRPRSEKRPIPDEQKDDKYFERRKRNNMAAKKSRDARKAREDEIALRACFLEKENAILRAQVTTLREEAQSLRQLLLQKRHSEWCKT
ncbi:thyrotroph embryonic factor-like [Parasteatoda tepidariorum]|uniref:thyrotroph embryonic factor-like n=1 Tax=Parasteatoda tepidariorum TaxID=114398 RepID=UPI0039BD141F